MTLEYLTLEMLVYGRQKPVCSHFVARVFRKILAERSTHFICKRLWPKGRDCTSQRNATPQHTVPRPQCGFLRMAMPHKVRPQKIRAQRLCRTRSGLAAPWRVSPLAKQRRRFQASPPAYPAQRPSPTAHSCPAQHPYPPYHRAGVLPQPEPQPRATLSAPARFPLNPVPVPPTRRAL